MLSRRGFMARMLCATAVIPVVGPICMLTERPAMVPGAVLRHPDWYASIIFKNQLQVEAYGTGWMDTFRTLEIDFERSEFRDEAVRQRMMEVEASRLETWTAFKMPEGTTVEDVEYLDPEWDTEGDQLVTIHKSDKPSHCRVQPHERVEFVFEDLDA